MKRKPAYALPHERDESARPPGGSRRRRVAQGAADVERGLKDTERRGAPSDVPAHRRRSRRV